MSHISSSRSAVPCLLCIACFLCLPAFSQQPPSDAAEIARDLLYQPAHRIEMAPGGVLLRGERFTYRFDAASSQWDVRPEKNFTASELPRAVRSYRLEPNGTTYHFAAADSDQEGILEIRPFTDVEGAPLARVRLWTRQQLAGTWIDTLRADLPRLTEPRLRDELEVAEPEVAAVAEHGGCLWLAIRYYAGEGFLGLGMVVRFDPKTNDARIYRSTELDTASVTHIVEAAGKLWLGTVHEGEGFIGPAAGLVRFDAATEEFRSYRPGKSSMAGSIVTALGAEPNFLWVATDAGACRLALDAESWQCWRFVPVVRLLGPVPVSNRPGDEPRGRLPAGIYEVRWANASFFEVVTPDAMEGWLEGDDFEDYTRRQFDARPFELANTYGGGAGVMRLLEEPDSDPIGAAQVFRAPLERAGEPNAEGWLRVRARVGWILRENLEVSIQIQPVSK